MAQYSPYQIFPDLLSEEYEALKESIAVRGVEIPKVADQDAQTLDGFHRQRACDELGIDCPTEVRHFATEAEKYEFVLRVNCRRRQLNRKQKEKLIEIYLLRDPQIADNNLATLIGISKNTIAKARGRLVDTCQIDKFPTLRGRDGKERPTKYKRIIANSAKEVEAAMKVISDLPDNCEGKVLDAITAQRRARRNKKRVDREKKQVPTLTSDDIKLYHCRFQELERLAGIKEESVSLIQTDIPYHAEFLPQVSELAAMASRILVPGGLLVMQIGGLYIPEIERRLDEHLTWQHPGVTVWRGDANMLFPIKCASQYKPVLIYSKGDWTPSCRWGDVSWVTRKEKKLHLHQQPVEDVEFWLTQLSEPGDLVCDFCSGAFTVAVACFRHGRRFIGCDCEESHVETGRNRLAAVVAGLPDPATNDSPEEEIPCHIHQIVGWTLPPARDDFAPEEAENWFGRKLTEVEEAMRLFFADKPWWVGGQIPLVLLYDEASMSLVLDTETASGLRQAADRLGERLGPLVDQMRARGIPDKYHGGLALLYLRLCHKRKAIDERTRAAS